MEIRKKSEVLVRARLRKRTIEWMMAKVEIPKKVKMHFNVLASEISHIASSLGRLELTDQLRNLVRRRDN